MTPWRWVAAAHHAALHTVRLDHDEAALVRVGKYAAGRCGQVGREGGSGVSLAPTDGDVAGKKGRAIDLGGRHGRLNRQWRASRRAPNDTAAAVAAKAVAAAAELLLPCWTARARAGRPAVAAIAKPPESGRFVGRISCWYSRRRGLKPGAWAPDEARGRTAGRAPRGRQDRLQAAARIARGWILSTRPPPSPPPCSDRCPGQAVVRRPNE